MPIVLAGNRAYCYAELAISSLVVAIIIASNKKLCNTVVK